MFQGSFVALVTPFRDGKVDEKAYGELINWQIEQGTDGIVPCGCTGEAATLSHQEHQRVVSLAVEAVAGRCPVIAGTGSNNTAEAIMLTRHAEQAGADAALVITPYYNKPTMAGQISHYQAIAEATSLPIMLYNVPSRTGISLAPETVARLARHPRIKAIKESSGDLDQVSAITVNGGITVLSGDDSLTLPIMAVGGRGVVSVAANVVPAAVHDLVHAFLSGDSAGAREKHAALFPLFRALFIETNPLPVKTALAWMGRLSPEWRLPLGPMTTAGQQRLRPVLEQAGLL